MTDEIDPLFFLEGAWRQGWAASCKESEDLDADDPIKRSFFRIVFFSGAYSLMMAQRELYEVARSDPIEAQRKMRALHDALERLMDDDLETEH